MDDGEPLESFFSFKFLAKHGERGEEEELQDEKAESHAEEVEPEEGNLGLHADLKRLTKADDGTAREAEGAEGDLREEPGGGGEQAADDNETNEDKLDEAESLGEPRGWDGRAGGKAKGDAGDERQKQPPGAARGGGDGDGATKSEAEEEEKAGEGKERMKEPVIEVRQIGTWGVAQESGHERSGHGVERPASEVSRSPEPLPFSGASMKIETRK